MSVRIKTKLLCKHSFTVRCQTFGCWHWSLNRKEAQCLLFIFVGRQFDWLSNKRKSPCTWEIIIKQRTSHWTQCTECVNAGGEQVWSHWFSLWVISTQQGKQGFSHSEVMMYFILIGSHVTFLVYSLVTIVLTRLLRICISHFTDICHSHILFLHRFEGMNFVSEGKMRRPTALCLLVTELESGWL